MYEHVEDEKEQWDEQTVDKASREKAREQRNEVETEDDEMTQFGEEKQDTVEDMREDEDEDMDEDGEKLEELQVDKGKSRRRRDGKENVAKMSKKDEMEMEDKAGNVEDERDDVTTLGADFEGRSFFEAKLDLLQRDITSEVRGLFV